MELGAALTCAATSANSAIAKTRYERSRRPLRATSGLDDKMAIREWHTATARRRWREEQAFREHCERLEDAEHEIRERLAYTPYGEERERLEYRLGEIHQERERSWHR
jgi:hypothetical protein